VNGKGNCQDAENAARESVQVFPSAAQQVQKTPYVLLIPLQSGVILNKTGRFRDAESYLRQAVETRTRLLPKGVNQLMSVAEGAVGECLTTQRCFLEAEPYLQRSHAAMRTIQGENGASTCGPVSILGQVRESLGVTRLRCPVQLQQPASHTT